MELAERTSNPFAFITIAIDRMDHSRSNLQLYPEGVAPLDILAPLADPDRGSLSYELNCAKKTNAVLMEAIRKLDTRKFIKLPI
jgi:hypothetical protein